MTIAMQGGEGPASGPQQCSCDVRPIKLVIMIMIMIMIMMIMIRLVIMISMKHDDHHDKE